MNRLDLVSTGIEFVDEVRKGKLSTEDIGHAIAYQAKIIHDVGMTMLNEAESLEGSKKMSRLREGVKTLGVSSRIFRESAAILSEFEPPPVLVAEARERLIEKAIEGGYELAFEADGRVVMERYGDFRRRGSVEEA